MAYELTQEQQILRETIRDFAENYVAPLASKIDWDCKIPQELLRKIPELGLYGITVGSELGGAGADFLSLVIAIEELSKASGSLGAILSFHNGVVSEAISTSKMSSRETLLRKLTGGSLGAFDFSTMYEENASKQVRCYLDGSKLIVNGNLEYVSNASSAEIFLILGRIGDGRTKGETNEYGLFAFSKEKLSSESFKIGEVKKLLGMRAAGVAGVSFRNLELPLDSLVYEISSVKQELLPLLSRARLAIAAQGLGIAQAAIDASVRYANERSQFETKIGNFYAVQDMIASDCIDLELARNFTYQTAEEIKGSVTLGKDSAIAKNSSTSAAIRASRHAIRVHGGYGFTRDYPVERYARDARLTAVWIESSEDLKAAIARSLLGHKDS